MSTYKSIITITQYDVDKQITVNGWIDTARFSKKTAFIKIYDSWKTHLEPLQIVFDLTKLSEDTKQELLRVTSGCSIRVTGTLVASPKPQQPFELQASDIKVLGIITDPATYPIAKTDLSLDYLRSYPHLECYSVSKSAIYGVRSVLLDAINCFFSENDFTKCDMPLITFSECEGGCQPMQATLLLTNGTMSDIPVLSDSKNKIDFTKDFFGRKASLTVSSQLELETQLPLGNVWTMTRAVRGEPSATSRHLAEFSMLELEMPFIESAKDIVLIGEDGLALAAGTPN